jgi:hypothetical protein
MISRKQAKRHGGVVNRETISTAHLNNRQKAELLLERGLYQKCSKMCTKFDLQVMK